METPEKAFAWCVVIFTGLFLLQMIVVVMIDLWGLRRRKEDTRASVWSAPGSPALSERRAALQSRSSKRKNL